MLNLKTLDKELLCKQASCAQAWFTSCYVNTNELSYFFIALNNSFGVGLSFTFDPA